jgi:hypothetical protein
MGINIDREENLLKVNFMSNTTTVNPENNDILSKINRWYLVVFKDEHGEYPNGKVIRDMESGLRYTYEYKKDFDGNVLSCKVYIEKFSTAFIKSRKCLDKELIYDSDGRLIEENIYNEKDILVKRTRFTYYDDGTIKTKETKGNQTITTKEFDTKGRPVFIWDKTISSGAISRKKRIIYDGDQIRYIIDYDMNEKTTFNYDKNPEGKIISKVVIIEELNTRKPKSVITTTYAPSTDYQKVMTIVKDCVVIESYVYDVNGELIRLRLKEGENEIMSKIVKTIDPETGDVTQEKTTTIITNENISKTHVVKTVHDSNNNLLFYAEDNSKVTTYTYNDQNKRTTAITKQLVDGNFIVVDEITYSYETDPETGEEIITRVELIYDKDGNVVAKSTQTEKKSDSKTEFSNENRFYEAPSNSTP